VGNKINSEWLTAKMRLVLSMGDKDVSLSGSLKMKRGEVIQLSLTFPIVGEVGRMEFSPTNVLIIDRINARYVRVPYDRVDFLRSADLDFKVLESVFWNEVFYPGGDVKAKLGEYRVSEAGDHTLLSLSTAPKLDYDFLTMTESALLDRTTVSPKNVADKSALTCIYSDFVKFESTKFPSSIKISFVGDRQKYGLDISLSSLSTASDWKTHTEVSAKYREMDVESLLKNLIP
ncbi:MAG: DUF4292 domain-containing protein, partial [Bacteroidaceae bacterium]